MGKNGIRDAKTAPVLCIVTSILGAQGIKLGYSGRVQLALFPEPSRRHRLSMVLLRWRIQFWYWLENLPLRLAAVLFWKMASVPRLRRIAVRGTVFTVPIFLACAFGTQSVSPVRDVFNATVFFALAALWAAIAILLWEDVRPDKPWAKVFVIAGLN